MQAVILAGGQGSRLAEETSTRPKPMVPVGGRPLLWHLMKSLGAQGINEFVICCGYKGYMIKEYYAHYFLHNADFTIDLKTNVLDAHPGKTEPWRVSVIDTGELTQTGGRLLRVRHLLDDEPFLMTYGDGLADVGITVNRNAVPFDPRPPMVSSGLRIGTPALATRGFGRDEFAAAADIVAEALVETPTSARRAALRRRVAALAARFPLYPTLRDAGS